MSFIFDFIDWIVNLFTSIYDFFLSFIDSLLLFFEYLSEVSSLCSDLILGLPLWLRAFGTITIFVSILYMILGRNTGGK